MGQRASERGAGTVLIGAVILFGTVIAALATVVVCYLMAAERARGAADLVALSAATVYESGRDPCLAARDAARANGVVLDSCEVTGDSLDLVVTATVRVSVGVPGLPADVTATSYAGWLGG